MKKVLFVVLILFICLPVLAESFDDELADEPIYTIDSVDDEVLFEINKLEFNEHLSHTKVIGEMTNHFKDYKTAVFKITAYDKDTEIIDTSTFLVNNFPHNSTNTFDTYILNTNPSEIVYFAIQIEN